MLSPLFRGIRRSFSTLESSSITVLNQKGWQIREPEPSDIAAMSNQVGWNNLDKSKNNQPVDSLYAVPCQTHCRHNQVVSITF